MQRRGRPAFLHHTPLCLLLLALSLAGCTSAPPRLIPDQPVLPPLSDQPVLPPQVVFPPQVAMEHGDYARFAAENHQVLEWCEEPAGCAVALFNLGFVHAYPRSPYYDPAKALQYFDTLLTRYPQTPWAFQGQAWTTLIHEKLALEETRRRLQTDLRTQEATIRSLQGRLKRFRDIDLQMDKKEQELLR